MRGVLVCLVGWALVVAGLVVVGVWPVALILTGAALVAVGLFVDLDPEPKEAARGERR